MQWNAQPKEKKKLMRRGVLEGGGTPCVEGRDHLERIYSQIHAGRCDRNSWKMFPLEIMAKWGRIKIRLYIGDRLGVSHNIFTATAIDERE
jgi:hypothetical protein